MLQPSVTILIRSMLRPELSQAIASIEAQTYPNIRIHVVNASGNPIDNSIVHSKLPLTFFQPENPLKRAEAANFLLTTVGSGFAIFLDEDDVFYENHIEKLVNALDEYPLNIAAYTGVSLYQSELEQSGLDEPWNRNLLLIANYLPIHAVLFRINDIHENRYAFDEQLDLMEDWDFWLQLSQSSDFIHIPGISAVYRMDLGQSGLSAYQNDTKQLQSHHQVTRKWQQKLSNSTGLSEALLWMQGNYQLMQQKIHKLEKKVIDLTWQKSLLEKVQTPMSYPSSKYSTTIIDVIIPIYKGLDETQACIKSVLHSANQANFELILINDCSPEPELTEWLRAIKELPRVRLIENLENLGFVATVNKGMALSENDVLLLNSDTEVADGWLDRIYQTAQQDQTIGTVTPFSNNATICSYPKFCEDNELPRGWSFQALDQLFADTLSLDAIDIPSAVGFCMFIKRECLKQVGLFNVEAFGKGYGEENDFSRRAVQAGWRNVLAANVFVWHKGNVSFGDSHNDRKAEALRKLDKMYPDYHSVVHEHIQLDPAKDWRYAIDLARWKLESMPHVLFVSHNGGGGTETHTRELANALESNMRVFMLKPDEGGHLMLEAYNQGEAMRLWFDYQNLQGLTNILKLLDISLIHFHHLLGFKLEVLSVLMGLNVRKVFTAHDYYSFCPQITMTQNEREYCQEKGIQQCQTCLQSTAGLKKVNIVQWREGYQDFLSSMDLVICPSQYVKNKIDSYFPNVKTEFLSHPDTNMLPIEQVCSPSLQPLEKLRIAVVGAISPAKGADRLLSVAKLAYKLGLEVEFKVFGFLYKPVSNTQNLSITGAYDNQDLPEMLQVWQPHLVWFPGDFPETHCYTLSTVLSVGIPVLSNDLGAVAERIASRPMCYQLPWNSSNQKWCDWFSEYRQTLIKQQDLVQMWMIPQVPKLTESTEYLKGLKPAKLDDVEAQHLLRFTSFELSSWQKVKLLALTVAFKVREMPVSGQFIGLIPDAFKKKVKHWLQGH